MKRGYIVVLYSVYWQKQEIHRQKGYFIRTRIPQVFLDIFRIKSSCTCLEDLHLIKILWINPSSKSSLNNLKGGEEKQQKLPFTSNGGMLLDRVDSTNLTRSLPENLTNDTTLKRVPMLNNLIQVKWITRKLVQWKTKEKKS